MVARINGRAVRIAALNHAGLFKTLLRAVMARLAQGLPVQAVKEKFGIATMGLDVIDDGCRNLSTKVEAAFAPWPAAQVLKALNFPGTGVVQILHALNFNA